MYNIGFSDEGTATQIGSTNLPLQACPVGYQSAVSKYTGRKMCVAAKAAVSACPPGYVRKFFPATRQMACVPVAGIAAQPVQQNQANMISALRGKPALQAPAQALKQIYAGGPTGSGAAMAMSAQARLSGERQQTAEMSPLIQQQTGIDSMVTKSGAGTLAQKDYTPAAVAAARGWMPGCKLICPPANAMGVRAKVSGE
jgi:hypothetical protein